MRRFITSATLSALAFTACDDGDGKKTDDTLVVPATYSFESKFVDGASSVGYDGQIMRHLLIEDLKSYMGSLTAQIDGAQFEPTAPSEVVAAFDYYFRFDSEVSGSDSPRLAPTPAAKQATYDQVSKAKDLVGKIAGNDSATDAVDYKNGGFLGWNDASIAAHGGSITSPEGLVTAFFATIGKQATDRVDGVIPEGTDGKPLPVYVTATGLDLRELTQKFLTGAIAFHQAADDYLDDAQEGKGLRSSNLAPTDPTTRYTTLEHQWDEGFGYFGAAIDYADYTDEELAAKGGRATHSKGYADSNGDGAIDLLSEYNFGHSTNLGKRDLGAKAGGETDYTKEAIDGFLRGRAIIHNAAGRELTDSEFEALLVERDRAINAWEKGIAATALHYINDTLIEMAKFGTEAYSFATHAKVWSELKGFALSLQFNPRSMLSRAQFTELNDLIGDKPVLSNAGESAIADYQADLRAARDLLIEAYEFPAANKGGENGENGW
ncbi:MAG TPA: DUF4856 domain-containing protein [Myxococcota bacterium]|nr:DUF4856 domain-containing protein [Myxococcota bacterium]